MSSDGTITMTTGTETPSLIASGPCLQETIAALEAGHGSGKPMPAQTLAPARAQVEEFVCKILTIYSQRVAKGEVGLNGTGKASEASPLSGSCPTGLLYGRIQSGKTLAMTLLSALALDNGFKIIVLLTSDNVKLVEQTAQRLSAVVGPIIKDATNIDEWDSDVAHVQQNLAHNGLILICSKNSTNLAKVSQFLNDMGASEVPGLILDDEADQATLDTNLSRRARSDEPETINPSTIYRRTVDDPQNPEAAIRNIMRHNVFVQVTATPYSMLLLTPGSPLRPEFFHLLEPGDGYCGGESFFSTEIIESKSPPLVFVDESESQFLNSPRGHAMDGPPLGLQRALCFYVLAAATQRIRDMKRAVGGQNFLCHTSPLKQQHGSDSDMIRNYVIKLIDDIRATSANGPTWAHLQWAYEELKKTRTDAPSIEELLKTARRFLPTRQVITVNSDASATIPKGFNVLIGGNILGRGLTIENLLVTYYTRKAKLTQMDTMYQHARMFGYRRPIMDLTRVFLPETLAVRFNGVHEAESALRTFLRENPNSTTVPIQRLTDLRPTRPNVLDPYAIGFFSPGQHVHPNKTPELSPHEAAREDARFSDFVRDLKLDTRSSRWAETTIDSVIDQIKAIEVSKEEPGNWDAEALSKVLLSLKPKYENKAFVYHREMTRDSKIFPTGAFNSAELREVRLRELPVFCLFRDPHRRVENYIYWYPAVVFPSNMTFVVYNPETG